MNVIKYIAEKLNKKWVKGFKQLTNSPVSLMKYDYISKILVSLENFYATEKTDGERIFLLINPSLQETNQYGQCFYITSKEIFSFDLHVKLDKEYIFDCEMMNKVIYIFDVIVFAGENVSELTFKERYNLLKTFDSSTKNIKIKKFEPLKINSYQKTLVDLYKLTKKSNVDGIIFTKIDEPYNKTHHYKWKSPALQTVDFLAVEEAPGHYILMTGINSRMASSFGLQLEDSYKKLLAQVPGLKYSEEYFPIPFYNSLISHYHFKSGKAKLPSYGIFEMSYKNNEWKLHKIRHDREVELSTGTYFGNNYKVAELTVQSILNPITLKDLTTNYAEISELAYFHKEDSGEFAAARAFNNYAKRALITRYRGSENVMDMACGRGGDLGKYSKSNMKNLLMIDIDRNALDELLNRKYEILPKSQQSCNLVIQCLDLNKKHSTNISLLSDNNSKNWQFIKKENFSVIFCHFALHYLAVDEKHIQNIADYISYYLRSGGEFVATFFDRERVLNLLKSGGSEWKTDKYFIQLTDKSIKVKLPFANKLYDEILINQQILDKIFRKAGLIKKEEQSFEKMLINYTPYKIEQTLDEDDKTFISLYKYVIYSK